jgi:hypothetical protein
MKFTHFVILSLSNKIFILELKNIYEKQEMFKTGFKTASYFQAILLSKAMIVKSMSYAQSP